MKFNLFLSVCLFASLTLVSCSGEDGEQGIQGVQGPQGEQGPQGVQGEQGIVGEDGNANVQKLEFELSFIPDGENDVVIDNISEFTPEALVNNVLITYLEISDDSDTIYTLIPGYEDGLQLDISVTYVEGALALFFFNLDGTLGEWPDLPENISVILHVTMVEISPDSMAGKNKTDVLKGLKNAGVDINDYNQVMSYYGIN